MSSPGWKKSVLLKKLYRYGVDFIRPYLRSRAAGTIIFANSFPKSGTHLLTQVLNTFGAKDYGNFVASTPSLTMSLRSDSSVNKQVSKFLDGEMISGHLFWSDSIEKVLCDMGVMHFFIYRDPRDVLLSECHYLTKMNRWHRLHSAYSQMSSLEQQLEFSILGMEHKSIYFPNIAERMSRYTPWINSEAVCSLSYEGLYQLDREATLEKIYDFYSSRSPGFSDKSQFLDLAEQSINPRASHTFNTGGINKWQTEMPGSIQRLFEEVAGEELQKWGYQV